MIQIYCGTDIFQKVDTKVAKFLAKSGYDAITFDYRGIGNLIQDPYGGFKASLEDERYSRCI
ncbi:MAG: hypothetical protein AAGI25_09480 [Bacteroidota bacterium]